MANVNPENQSFSYAQQAFSGQPANMANERAKLEELKEMQEQIDHKTTVEERKLNFLAALMSEKTSSSEHAGIRIFLFDFIENDGLDTIIMTLILLNSFLIVLRGASYECILKYGYLHDLFEPIFLAFYVWEAVVKIVVYKSQYFRVVDEDHDGLHPKYKLKGWNIFDFLIVMVSLLDFFISTASVFSEDGGTDSANSSMQTQYFKITRFLKSVRMLKSLRSLRIMRILKMVENVVDLVSTEVSEFKIRKYFDVLPFFFCVFHGFCVFDIFFHNLPLFTLDGWRPSHVDDIHHGIHLIRSSTFLIGARNRPFQLSV